MPSLRCFCADEAAQIEGAEFLAGNIVSGRDRKRPVSTDGPAATIKLHHNVGGLPEDLAFTLIEPLRDLFKDEVRTLGLRLGLPEEDSLADIVPPGRGWLCSAWGQLRSHGWTRSARPTRSWCFGEIKQAGLYRQTAQVFAVLLPVQSVGVMGDERT